MKKNLVEMRKLHAKKRLVAERISVTVSKMKALSENKRTAQAQLRPLIKEAAQYESLLILEASGMDLPTMIDMAEGMLMTIETLASRINADSLHEKVDSIYIPTADDLDNPTTVKLFQSGFAKLGAVTKVLMSIADDISNLRATEGGSLAEILNTLRSATPEGFLGDMMQQYDSMESEQPPMKRSFFSRKPKTKSVEQKMRDALQAHINKSPLASSLLSVDDLVNGLKNTQFKNIPRSFAAYNASTAEYVDNDFLMSMSKQPLTLKGMLQGAIKSFFDVGTTRSG